MFSGYINRYITTIISFDTCIYALFLIFYRSPKRTSSPLPAVAALERPHHWPPASRPGGTITLRCQFVEFDAFLHSLDQSSIHSSILTRARSAHTTRRRLRRAAITLRSIYRQSFVEQIISTYNINDEFYKFFLQVIEFGT